jgi:hypothetical protein
MSTMVIADSIVQDEMNRTIQNISATIASYMMM